MAENHPLSLDSRAPSKPFKEFATTEARYAMLMKSNPERAEKLIAAAQQDIDERRSIYEQLASMERGLPGEDVTA